MASSNQSQDNPGVEDVTHRNQEVLRLYGFRSSATGDVLAELAASASGQQIDVYQNHPSTTFEPFYFFFYGSLQVPTVLSRMCRLPITEPDLKTGSIEGWETMLWGRYPALVPKAGNVVKGMYWKCEDPQHVRRLCDYEGHAYRMEFCKITTDQGEVIENGRTFVSTSDKSELEAGTWNLQEFLDVWNHRW